MMPVWKAICSIKDSMARAYLKNAVQDRVELEEMVRCSEPENKIEGECTMDKKSEEIFNKLYDLHDRYDEDPKHMICAEAADHIKKLSEELEKLKATSENKALTLEQLQQMDGEPVWVVCRNINAPPCLMRVQNFNNRCVTDDKEYYELFADYGKTWLAYARKPEGSESR